MQSSSDHFQFIFQAEDSEAVGHLFSFADQVYEQLSELFGYQPQKKISVVVSGETAFANGSYTPLPPLLTLFTAASATRSIGARNVDYLKTLFVHELSHYFHLNTPVGLSHWATKVFGPATSAINTPFMPGWWVEGVALYTESQYSQGGRRDDLHFSLKHTAPLLTQESWSLAQGSYQGPKEPTGRIYSTGHVMLEHLVSTYGAEKISAITSRFQKFPFFGLTPAFKRELGQSPKELYQAALAERSRSLPAEIIEGEVFSPQNGVSYYLPHSTTKGYLGYAQGPSFGSAIVHYDFSTGDVALAKRLQISDVLSFATSYDGKTWLLAHLWQNPLERNWLAVSYSDLYLYHVDEQSYQRLTHGQRLFQGAISRDGTKAVALEQIESRFRLVQVLPSWQILFDESELSLYEPTFHPTGDAVVAVATKAGRSALVMIDLEGSSHFLTPFYDLALYQPRFTQTGDLLFSADYEGALSLYQLEIGSGTIRRILRDSVGVIGALEAGEYLIYQSYRADGQLLLQAPLSTLESEVVLLPTSEASSPVSYSSPLVTSAYRDNLRFGFWMPLPYAQEKPFTLGATIYWKSLLARHTLVLSPYWTVHQAHPTFFAHYLFSGTKINLHLNTTLLEPYYDVFMATERPGYSFEASLSLPLACHCTPSLAALWQAGMTGNLISVPKLNTVMSVALQSSAQLWTPSAKRNYFGSNALSARVATQLLHWTKSGQLELLLSAGVSAQLDLAGSGHLIAASAESLFTSAAFLAQHSLPAFGNPPWYYPTGKGKTRVTVFWGLPALLPDWPFLTGGFTRLAGLFFAQSSLYWRDSKVVWERELYFGGEVHADYTFHSAVALQLSAGIVARASDLAWHFYFKVKLPLALAGGSQPTLDQRAETVFIPTL